MGGELEREPLEYVVPPGQEESALGNNSHRNGNRFSSYSSGHNEDKVGSDRIDTGSEMEGSLAQPEEEKSVPVPEKQKNPNLN